MNLTVSLIGLLLVGLLAGRYGRRARQHRRSAWPAHTTIPGHPELERTLAEYPSQSS